MRLRTVPVVVCLALTITSNDQRAVAQSVTGGFGVMGDSNSDEYRADDNRGGSYASTTLNWLELLVRYRGVNAGNWGTRGEPRRTGYDYNWARSGVRVADVITGGQAAGLAQQVASGQVSTVMLMVGANDFTHGNGTYQEIYNGVIAGSSLQAKVDAIVTHIEQALDLVRASAPGSLSLFVANIADSGNTAAVQALFPDAVRRARVTNAILAVNAGIATAAAVRDAAVIDMYAMAGGLLADVDAAGNLRVGNEFISLVGSGDAPHYAVLADAHAGTVLSGILANYYIDTFNSRGLAIQTFSDDELLTHAGIGVADHIAPVVQLTGPDGPSVSGSVVLTAEASDTNGVAGVQFKVDNVSLGSEDTSAPYSRTWNATSVTPGPHTITAVARDTAGNTATVERLVAVVDVSAPSVSISSPSANARVAGSVTIAAAASDNIGVAGVTFYWNGAAIGGEDTQAPYSIAVQTTTAQNGVVSLTASARDTSGNARTSNPVSVTVDNPIPDTTNPTVAITGPADGTTVSKTLNVTASASDNVRVVGVRFKVDGNTLGSEDTIAPYSVSWNTTGAANGPHVLTATVRDAAGNTATSTASVNVLNIAPEILAASTYVAIAGTTQSGNVGSLSSDDNNYLSLASQGSGFTRAAEAQVEFAAIVAPISRLEASITLKSSRSSTSVSVSAYNFASGTWTALSSFSVGTIETTRTVTLPSNVINYIGLGGVARIRARSTTTLASHSLSLDRVSLAVTH